MKVTYNWLKDFVEIKLPAAELAHKLTMAGLEVKAIEEKAGDFVFEIEITSNRPDWLSVAGIAREVAAITGKSFKGSQGHLPQADPPAGQAGRHVTRSQVKGKNEKFEIEIEDKKDCPLYTARVIRNVKVGPSPEWLRERLELIGLRSVNNVVDITNYVLFELGEPLHAFDLDKLSPGSVIIRRAKNGEELVSIDGQVRKLTPDTLVIADKLKPVAVAGVMGGKDTEVVAATKNVLLEAAIFDPVVVRRSRQRLGMNSDASYRFERGIDPESVEPASLRAAWLIRELCAGEDSGMNLSGAAGRKSPAVDLFVADVERYLGVEIALARIKSILSDLGFGLKSKNKNVLSVSVPSWRLDVRAGIDLVEEVARIYGYENIPATLASVVLKSQKEKSTDVIGLIKNTLSGLGLNEAITYSLVERKSLAGFWDKSEALIEVANPLSLEQEVLRPVLMASLCQRVAHNLRQQAPQVRLFEIARVYSLEGARIREKYSLGFALCGAESLWLGPKQGHIQDSPDFLHLKGIIDTLLERLSVKTVEYRFLNNREAELLVNREKAGILRKLSRENLEALDIKHKDVFAAEIYLEEKILPQAHLERRFNPAGVPRFPGITRDITLPVRTEISFAQISQAIAGMPEPLLAGVGFKDCYEGEKAAAGFKKITVSLRYCSVERTLTEEEVSPVHGRLVRSLEEKFQIKIS